MSLHFYLFNNPNQPKYWREVLSHYEKVLKLKADKMKPDKGRDLIKLDKWFQEELPGVISARKEKFLTKDELCRLMKWKLTRGKFRPRLTELVSQNSEELVDESSRKAFSELPDVSSALTCLTVLRGVGPATASGILAAGCPNHAAFMADESMLSIPGLQPLSYTASAYKTFSLAVKKLKTALNKNDSVKDWTSHQVELALWTFYMGEKLNPGMFSNALSTDDASTQKEDLQKPASMIKRTPKEPKQQKSEKTAITRKRKRNP